MRAYKFLRAGAVGPFSRFAWPVPRGDAPGPWVEAADFRGACGRGVHACTTAQLARWLDAELWEIELDGDLVTTIQQVIARRGRLVARVARWDGAARAALAAAGVERARALVREPDGLAAGFLADAIAFERQDAAASLFCAAHAAGTEAGYHDERRWQSRWLAAYCDLAP